MISHLPDAQFVRRDYFLSIILMPKLRKDQHVQAFNHLTQKLKRGRIGIKPEFVPELAAWLMLQAGSYERMKRTYTERNAAGKDPVIAGMKDYVEHALACIQVLMNSLMNGWELCHWNEATSHVAEHLGIVYGEPLPADITHVEDLNVAEKVRE